MTPQYREMEIKAQLLESGWTLKDIEESDIHELMKILAFKDAVKEFESTKHLDDYTMF